jgi:hypothetical protein
VFLNGFAEMYTRRKIPVTTRNIIEPDHSRICAEQFNGQVTENSINERNKRQNRKKENRQSVSQ